MSQLNTAQRRAEALVMGWKKRVNETIIDNHYSPTTFHGEMMADIADALLQTRRAALEEASKVVQEKAEFICHDYDQNPIGDLEWFHRELIGRFADYACDALDRLREGVGG